MALVRDDRRMVPVDPSDGLLRFLVDSLGYVVQLYGQVVNGALLCVRMNVLPCSCSSSATWRHAGLPDLHFSRHLSAVSSRRTTPLCPVRRSPISKFSDFPAFDKAYRRSTRTC